MFISAPSFLVLSPISRQAKLISRNEWPTKRPSLALHLPRVQLPSPRELPPRRYRVTKTLKRVSFFLFEERCNVRDSFEIWEFHIVRIRSILIQGSMWISKIFVKLEFSSRCIPWFRYLLIFLCINYGLEQWRTQDVSNYSTKIRVLKNGMEISINRRSIELILRIFMLREIYLRCLFCSFKKTKE